MSDTNLIRFTQSLIRCPSPPGEESAVVDLILAEMRAVGFDAFWRDDVGNAVGVIMGAEPGPTLLLDSHCDTVGIAPGVPWRHDPFGAEIEDGFIYGRGAADMKGALAAMIHAAAGVERSRLRGRLLVTATVMEENLEGAALKAVMDAIPPDFVVIGEATELRLVRGGRGRAEIHLETIGRPAHSSTPHLGRNAVLDMLPVIQAIAKLPLPADPFLGPGVLALTDIISDPYPAYSVIPSRCRVTYDRRLLAGETEEGVLGEHHRSAGPEARSICAPRSPRVSIKPTPGPCCAGRSSCRPGCLMRPIPLFRRPCKVCELPVLTRRSARIASAPTRPTAQARPACRPSASGRAARRTRT